MFQGDRWADAFMGASGDHAGESFLVLKAMVPLIAPLSGQIAGTGDAERLETMLRTALAPTDQGAEYAIRFVVLLVRKGCFDRLGAAFQAIEQRIDAKNGVCTVHVESAQPIEGDFQEKITAELIKKTGAREIRLVTQVVPELLGGYRLRIGTELVDTSLKGQLQRMAAEAFSMGGFRW
jgi:F-type H+-transporting ATPase subunit delta